MAFQYLPLMAQASAPKPPRALATPPTSGWCPLRKPLAAARVAILSSAALRLANQLPFNSNIEDLGYRLVPGDPSAGAILIDHPSGIGRVPRQDPEIVFPRSALVELAGTGEIGSASRTHISFKGGLRLHERIQTELAPAIARELQGARVDLAL